MNSVSWGDILSSIFFSLLIGSLIFVLLRPFVWWYYGTKETHRLLSEILAELKRGGAEKDADKKD